MRLLRSVAIVPIPYCLFWWLLRSYALIDNDLSVYYKTIESLVTPDEFEIIDWPGIFGISAIPLATTLRDRFRSSPPSSIALEF